MSYVERNLQPGETLVAQTRIHWWFVYRRAVFFAILAAALAGLSLAQSPDMQRWLLIAGGAALLLGILLSLGPAIERATTEFAVTNRRLIHKTGVLRRDTQEMNLSKVETVFVDQPMLGRLMNFGSVRVHGTGGYTEFALHSHVADPLRFRRAITAE